ncbi:MAG: 1-acylglycerol-3-phosphate O-acyltransferase [Proteobacteria bacterium]|nr:1-acylglycerol-3-phosphate O-acyltransferase [Pseudomonadota bacterium]NIS70281.1 1-acylglycerol-3-phosphate O-acyltransferase [Pseudomonadota bacterium]
MGRIIHSYARAWGWVITRSSGVQVTLSGVDHIDRDRPYILMANHQGAYDIFALLAYLPVDFKWLAKAGLFKIPIFGWAMGAAGYISIDRKGKKKALESIEIAVAKIRGGASVLVFPEGTRSPDGEIHPFKRGGFTLAIKAGAPIVPISIRGSREVLPRSSLRVKPGKIEIVVGKPIPTDNKSMADREGLMQEVRAAIESTFAR